MNRVFAFLVLGGFILYFSGPILTPFTGVGEYQDKLHRRKIVQDLDLNNLCAGTDKCFPQEIVQQEAEEVWIIQTFSKN